MVFCYQREINTFMLNSPPISTIFFFLRPLFRGQDKKSKKKCWLFGVLGNTKIFFWDLLTFSKYAKKNSKNSLTFLLMYSQFDNVDKLAKEPHHILKIIMSWQSLVILWFLSSASSVAFALGAKYLGFFSPLVPSKREKNILVQLSQFYSVCIITVKKKT